MIRLLVLFAVTSVLVFLGPCESLAQSSNSKSKQPKKQSQTDKKPDSGVLKLEDVQIEGEIDVPQVLFITARDSRRIRDKVHQNYLKSPSDVIRSVRLPRYLHVQPKEE
ncbi:MAG: hypothetical protein HKN21_14635 [Candidatus Eisenbacteria bacterium]|uniref:Uncharacterized protein n=1 Tax=Eiseniibacteriota bacterium TaxID=2212470 RepID=A0A7Y2EBQ8_UNCEI|nr:hypothetical protein [Candidatus Eisenbacteria bacterium]